MTSMNAADSVAQLMIVPGGTTPGAVTMTYSAVHKLWELYERFEKTGVQRKQRIILAPREASEAMPARAAQTNTALQKRITNSGSHLRCRGLANHRGHVGRI